MSDGAIVVGELEDLSTRLGNASTEIYRLQEEFAPVEERWEDTRNDLLTTILDEYEEADPPKRLPGEDVRNAMVIKRFRKEEPLLYGEYRRKKAELERAERLAKSIQQQVIAKQSVLSWLKVEMQAVAA